MARAQLRRRFYATLRINQTVDRLVASITRERVEWLIRGTVFAALLVAVLMAGDRTLAKPELPSPVGERIEYRGQQVRLAGLLPVEYQPGMRVLFDTSRQAGEAAPRYEVQAVVDEQRRFHTKFLAPKDGRVAIEVQHANGTVAGRFEIPVVQVDAFDPTEVRPINLARRVGDGSETIDTQPSNDISSLNPANCACECPPRMDPGFFNHSFTPSVAAVELATGKLYWIEPIVSFATRKTGFLFELYQTTLTTYDGPVGPSNSHNFNMMIWRDTEENDEFDPELPPGPTNPQYKYKDTGKIVTPNLRIYNIAKDSGSNWTINSGTGSGRFYSKLTLDTTNDVWVLAHYSGLTLTFEYDDTPTPTPGNVDLLLEITDSQQTPNTTTLGYTADLLTSITTDLSQTVSLSYTSSRLTGITDPMNRSWTIGRDGSQRTTSISTPAVDYYDVAAGTEVHDGSGHSLTTNTSRVREFTYPSGSFTNYIEIIKDERGASGTTIREHTYDGSGRVSAVLLNGENIAFNYSPSASPTPLTVLDSGNLITRVTDRVGNVTDYEMNTNGNSPQGGGNEGLRRLVCWTEAGKGNSPLRTGDPDHYQKRWLHDCQCLRPIKVSEWFSSSEAGSLTFDSDDMPTSSTCPRTIFTYNDNRQITERLFTDGTNEIKEKWEYEAEVDDKFFRLKAYWEPREYDTHSLYSGLSANAFKHVYTNDDYGNRLTHTLPTVTRGVTSSQTITHTWRYNAHGQVTDYIDPNGNITTYEYVGTNTGSGNDVTESAEFIGYLKTVTVGATQTTGTPTVSSADSATNLSTSYKTNELGMVTEVTDPRSKVTDYTLNNLGEITEIQLPTVTFRNSSTGRYKTEFYYDGAGHRILTRHTDHDFDTNTAGSLIDMAVTYDTNGNVIKRRVEIDDTDGNDLITEYAYDENDQLIAVESPEGNRTFYVYDELRRNLRTFYGIESGTSPAHNYPAKTATTLTPDFVGFTQTNFDGRGNVSTTRDGMGEWTTYQHDFANRMTAMRPPEYGAGPFNPPGKIFEYDDAGNIITESTGEMTSAFAITGTVGSRTYHRFDEAGRQYQRVLDGDISGGSESTTVDPETASNPSSETLYDAGSRVKTRTDALGNVSTNDIYDGANRLKRFKDAMASSDQTQIDYTYDGNGNATQIDTTEKRSSSSEMYRVTFAYDELNRRTETHLKGLNGTSIDHETYMWYDSRGNVRLVEDAEGKFGIVDYDYQNRPTESRRLDDDPNAPGVTCIHRERTVYDKNSRVTHRKAYTVATTPSGEQATLYAYDDLNRLIRTVYPDSDDTIGGGNGGDSTYDRVEYTYNAVSSITTVREQRAGIITNTLDELQRLTQSEVTTTPSGVTTGDTKRTYTFNTKGQLTDIKSNCAHVAFTYDDLWRVTTETQKIRIDGTGFTNGWGQAVDIDYEYNKNSLRTRMVVDSGAGSNDLDLDYAYNARLQLTSVTGDTFHNSSNTFVTYDYWGSPVYNKYLGGSTGPIKNERVFDTKRRLARNVWYNVPGSNAELVRTDYGYDDLDNPLWEQYEHDKVSNNGLYDNFRYNDKYELTGVNYREGSSADYRSSITVSDEFAYDANYNRGADIEDGDPFEYYGRSLIDYTANSANEYTAISGATAPVHDRAGNLTGLPSIPGTGTNAGTQKDLTAKWSAFNQLTQVDYGTKPDVERQADIYDGLNRRIARLTYQYAVFGEASYMIPDVGKRYIYDGFTCVEELLFDTDGEDEEEVFVDAGTLERVYVHGASIDEPLYCAIDRNGDRDVSDNRNAGGASDDAEFWYLPNRLGSILAIAEITFGETDTVRVLEYYKYSVYGQVDVLPIVDDGTGGGTASDGIEDTPTTLADNQSLMISNRASNAAAGRYSPFGNEFLFTARRLDARTGLCYYRHRYYSWLMGRFISRDPIGYAGGMNLYAHAGNRLTAYIDPLGLERVAIGEHGFSRSGTHESRMFVDNNGNFRMNFTWDYSIPVSMVRDGYSLFQEIYVNDRILCCGESLYKDLQTFHWMEFFYTGDKVMLGRGSNSGIDMQTSVVTKAMINTVCPLGVAAISFYRELSTFTAKVNPKVLAWARDPGNRNAPTGNPATIFINLLGDPEANRLVGFGNPQQPGALIEYRPGQITTEYTAENQTIPGKAEIRDGYILRGQDTYRDDLFRISQRDNETKWSLFSLQHFKCCSDGLSNTNDLKNNQWFTSSGFEIDVDGKSFIR